MNEKILIVDNDPVFNRLVELVLSRAGYKVSSAIGGVEGLRLLFKKRPDMVLLDVDMPTIDCWQTYRRIRDICDVPVIMLSGRRKSEQYVVRGLNSGADDYITKPVGGRELLARVQAVLRRRQPPSAVDGIAYSDNILNIDLDKRRVILSGERVCLTPKEFKLFSLLLRNADCVVSHKTLLEKVWGWEYANDIDHVRICIWHLRRKIEPQPSKPRYIINEPGVGYIFRRAKVSALKG